MITDNKMGFIPYELQNVFDGSRTPTSVKNNSYAYAFWCRALYQRLCSIIEFELPEEWKRAKDFFEACLFGRGFLAVLETSDYGTIFQPGNISGFDLYYQPVRCLIANPYITLPNGGEFTIGKDCELIKLTPDFNGVCDIVTYYAEKLATIDGAINMSIINSKLAYVFGAKNKAGATAIKAIFDRINAGEPTIVYDTKIIENIGDNEPFEFIDRSSLKNSYITTDLLTDFKTLLDSFDTEIGIKTLGVSEKRERLISDEVNARQADASARITLWDECLKNSIENVNKKFGLSIGYTFRFLEDPFTDINIEEDEPKKSLKDWGLE